MKFRFGVMGAAKIARKFCEAAALCGCEVCAVASKSEERAKAFAEANGIGRYYADYEAMLEAEKPDAGYIATTTNDHARLSLLCIRHGVPVLCEKAAYENSEQARAVFSLAREKGVFVMEAMWSRFLPALLTAKAWVAEGRIGAPAIAQCGIGFVAPEGADNRYFSPKLGGGAARDITVYAYELTGYVLGQEEKEIAACAVRGETGVDVSDAVLVRYESAVANLTTSFVSRMEERLTVCGDKGRLVVPSPNFGAECLLYGPDGSLLEHFTDTVTKNGFTYEIEEVVRCVREGKTESAIVPWRDTLACAALFDQIDASLARQG